MTAFLAGENFPGTSIKILRDAGHDVVSIAEAAPAAADEDILSSSISRDRIVITFDRDFGELIFKKGLSSGAGIIYFPLALFTPDEPARLILEGLQEESEKFDGVFTVISRKEVRQRKL